MVLMTIPVYIVVLLVVLIPVSAISVALLLPVMKRRARSPRLLWLLDRLMLPPSFWSPLDASTSQEQPTSAPRKHLSFLSCLAFLYLCIVLFVLSNIIGVFYSVAADISRSVTQGGTGLPRIVTGVLYQDPFHGGWTGDLPWYGALPLPLKGMDTYHETWEWIFFTGYFAGEDFFLSMLQNVIGLTFIAGVVFLLPLLVRRIRTSFVPSLVFFFVGMTTATRALFGCFAQALKLGYLGDTLQFGLLQLSGAAIPLDVLNIVIFTLLPFVGLMFVLFPVLGYVLWKQHYPGNKRSTVWFAASVLILCCLNLLVLLW
jgi:hypothetical protein